MNPTPLRLPDDADDPVAERIAVAVVIDRGRVLVGQRPLGVPLAGYAEFPGGKVATEELPEDAAIRECHEEAGVRATVVKPLDVCWQRYESGDIEIHFYHCLLANQDNPRPPFHWVPLDHLAGYQFPPANETVLSMLRRMAAE